jgi:hypothetical protein
MFWCILGVSTHISSAWGRDRLAPGLFLVPQHHQLQGREMLCWMECRGLQSVKLPDPELGCFVRVLAAQLLVPVAPSAQAGRVQKCSVLVLVDPWRVWVLMLTRQAGMLNIFS